MTQVTRWTLMLTVIISGAYTLARAADERSTGWYSPQEADFRPVYKRDQANKTVQSWGEYWGWVQTFYAGNWLSSGWTSDCKNIIAGVKLVSKYKELQSLLNPLGRKIAGEWAKDNDVRKIDTEDLQRWGDQMRSAKAKDAGTGDELKRVILTIQSEVNKKVG
jgi:hypothetical protein